MTLTDKSALAAREQALEPEIFLELLEQVLPPIQLRVRRRRVDALARRLARLSAAEAVSDLDERFRMAILAVLIVRMVRQLQVELAALERRLAAHVQAYARAGNPAARRRRLEQMIDETAPSPRHARADRKALRRHLDLDALCERYDLQRDELIVTIELALLALGPAIELAVIWERARSEQENKRPLETDDLAELRQVLAQAEPVSFAMEQLASLRVWTSRLACLESAEIVLASFGVPDPSSARGHRRESPSAAIAGVIDTLRTVASDGREHEWVQARAVACLRHVDLDEWRALVRHRLGLDDEAREESEVGASKIGEGGPSRGPRDFLVRRLLVTQLVDHLDRPPDAKLLIVAIARGDFSEYVRQAHAQALTKLARHRPKAFAWLAEELTRTGEERESPRVRAQACMAIVDALEGQERSGDHPDSAARDEARAAIVGVVARCLAGTIAASSDPLVATIACEQAARSCELLVGEPGLAQHAVTLGEALHRCLAQPERSGAIHEAAAAALEAIDAVVRPERGAWTQALAGAIEGVRPGSERIIEVPEHEGRRPDADELGRIFAALTCNDWGLDVEPRRVRSGLRVRRGERRVLRLWRLLHELRNPASNKRQAFRHTIGRRYSGRLRAHPSRLDEVTATVVPGERLHIEAEGGWGRHLPLVDDLLGLRWWRRRGDEPQVELHSSYGVTSMRLARGLLRRLVARLRLNLSYPELSELRRRALRADEASERSRYAEELRTRYGVELEFRPHPSLTGLGPRPVPSRLQALFPRRQLRAEATAQPPPPAESPTPASPGVEARAGMVPALAATGVSHGELVPRWLEPLREATSEWFLDNIHYFFTLEGNSQDALGLFAVGLSGLFLGASFVRRREIAKARASIPLSIGGWGTRGKSGTERLKAGLFHGLGFRTFSKTTGCEAMFIHAPPQGPQVEIFTFRPYNKATIWEQRDLIELAAGLESEVFLWECMALNPEYVDILQRGWMRDDIATITNTYPDHEDVQGPAGIDVAEVIARFIPSKRLAISSELGFGPVLRQMASERDAKLIEVGDHEGELLAEDLLGLFPYAEHPRNVALVTELARQLGIDPDLAIVTMADHVYPDLGVLRVFPEVVVGGRRLSFVNGCSANERAGFVNNWRRTGCTELAEAADPARMVITVVNNRDDRVSRSEVFSRILVNDVSVDAHVLIGTNLAGLQIFIDRALEAFGEGIELIDAKGLVAGGSAHPRAHERLRRLLMRVRAPVTRWWGGHVAVLLELGLASLGRVWEPNSSQAREVEERISALRESEGSHDYEAVLGRVAWDRQLDAALRALHDEAREDPTLAPGPEVGKAASFDELLEHLHDRIARVVIAARLARGLAAALAARDPAGLTRFVAELARAWSALFRGQLVVVEDSAATGDQIVDRVARAVPPGVHVTIMGTQNIKGTGLDFIYRWQALDAVCRELPKLESADEQTRFDALRALDVHSDFGFIDTGILAARLAEIEGGSEREVELREALRDKVARIHRKKLAALDSGPSGATAKGGRFWTWIEDWIDFADGAVRYSQTRRLVRDLIDQRISHNKMAIEMREIYARGKGGWLGKRVAARLARRRSRG